ncbi:DnaA ATPase involved in DNA replication initiation [Rhabdaerophilaceae bacterium]
MKRDRQLLLPFESVPAYGREDFLVGKPNEAAFSYIDRFPRWLAPAALLVGPEGSGKSHLAAIFAQAAQALTLRGDHLTCDDVPALSRQNGLVIEDCDQFSPDERALFHLINLARETGVLIVLTARTPPEAWSITTPDLLSRLRAQPRLALGMPDEALLGALFVKLFADRQITIEAPVVAYSLARIERSYRAVSVLVRSLDQLSLARKRPITRALVAEVLGDVLPEAEDN